MTAPINQQFALDFLHALGYEHPENDAIFKVVITCESDAFPVVTIHRRLTAETGKSIVTVVRQETPPAAPFDIDMRNEVAHEDI